MPPHDRAGPRATRIGVDVACDGVRIGIARVRIGELAKAVLRAERVRDALVSITFVTAAAIRRLNQRHLGKRAATDVIAFGFGPETWDPGPGIKARRSQVAGLRSAVVADIYICPAVARANAAAYGDTTRNELQRLVVHGLLHVTGWDHPEGEARTRSKMWQRQESLLRRASRRSAA